MITANINLAEDVFIDPTSKINNAKINARVKIAANVNLYGSSKNPIFIDQETYIGPFCMLEGYNAKVVIGKNVSFAQRVTLLTGSAPNASLKLQKIFPMNIGEVTIGDHCWIGAHSVIMPNVSLGKFCVVAANSFVNKSFEDYSIVGGNPAKLIRKFTIEEIKVLND